MFERYTERARRVLFFARYEASQLGSISIETEHLLLGLIREGKGLTSRIFARSHLSLENIRKEIEGRTVFREKVSTSVEIPFSAETVEAARHFIMPPVSISSLVTPMRQKPQSATSVRWPLWDIASAAPGPSRQ